MARPFDLRPSTFDPHTQAIFLAPHYDDVALSCGGTVAAIAGEGGPPPLVVTVFGGEPEEQELTGFARWQHEQWGTAGTDTLATRRAEEAAAAALLGCDTRSLPYRDAIYRDAYYLSDATLFGTPHPDDAPLAARIAADVLGLPEVAGAATPATLYVPLAIGEHVDHQLVLAAGRIVAGAPERPWRVLAYEDFPYALLGNALARRLAAVAGEVGPAEIVPVAGTLARRIGAIEAYRTQLPVIFRHFADWRAALEGYARSLDGGNRLAERFWPVCARS